MRVCLCVVQGTSAIGHNRYSTAGDAKSAHNIQPFSVQYRMGNLALAHNGNLSNFDDLKKEQVEKGTLFQSTTDSELILHLISQSKKSTQVEQVVDALNQLEGAFSLCILTDDYLIACRDPNGFRPLVMGKLENNNREDGNAYLLSSETCAFDLLGAEFVREIEPGEVLLISRDKLRAGVGIEAMESFRLRKPVGGALSPCVFEFIYFARPDSHIFGATVDMVRSACGMQLAKEAPLPELGPDDQPICIMAVPDSANSAALGYARELVRQGVRAEYEFGLIRNHYVGRTFIAPSQDARELKVRCKFNVLRSKVQDRIVVLVDDSIVRGTTSRQLMKMMKKAGAKEVHFRVTSPPVTSPCFYGMDFPSKEELIANRFDNQADLASWLQADSLHYLSVDGMMSAVRSCNTASETYCTACFTGEYPIEVTNEPITQKGKNGNGKPEADLDW